MKRYELLASELESSIRQGVFRPGERYRSKTVFAFGVSR